jgi:excisionase family DNA binding protein
MCEAGCPLLAAVRDEVRKVLGEAQRPEASGPLLVTVAQAAEALALGQTEVYRLLQSGELASVKVGRARRVVAASLQQYVQRLEAEQGEVANG